MSAGPRTESRTVSRRVLPDQSRRDGGGPLRNLESKKQKRVENGPVRDLVQKQTESDVQYFNVNPSLRLTVSGQERTATFLNGPQTQCAGKHKIHLHSVLGS